jgi:mannose-1-phosphate guanylyltransferase
MYSATTAAYGFGCFHGIEGPEIMTMSGHGNTWALVLAAGEGSRLHSLTRTQSGSPVPKQFCSLWQGPSLFHDALIRARAVASNEYICAVVARQHHGWWQGLTGLMPSANIIVQPHNRGTANGILLPLLHILARDPNAQIVILPSDHHVREEAVLAHALWRAVEQLRWRIDETVLLGLEPVESDSELGYIVPGDSDGRGALEVEQFVEKPTLAQAHEIIEHGGLWNAFILASSGQALLSLFRRRMPEIVSEMRAAVQHDLADPDEAPATAELYGTLPNIDFSRDILQGQERRLRVLPVAQCGWSDLGTPERIGQVLDHGPRSERRNAWRSHPGHLSLAVEFERRRIAAGLCAQY